ncbi:DNA recombination protein RmuC [Hydrogenimonas cancrithermarum]|uniref:DNA recombination protein RmuC n=1 Tax=Hydrogenimonas cancrithermarum TaxID=2993563 RepID=A0ABM8FLG1_9BACT|nr:DNA recombination protein RmuC [Hydrogenimonas cancrithermarum]BDY13190.1 DNA recombination protein RmuC [Hydrogenimonas cancrithermarum]
MQIPMEWIFFALGLLAGLVVAALFAYMVLRAWRKAFEKRMGDALVQKDEVIDRLERDLAAADADVEKIEHLLDKCRFENSALKERVAHLGAMEESLSEHEAMLDAMRGKNVALEKEVSELSTRLEEERRQSRLRLNELKEAKEVMQREFKVLASQVMEENSRRFGRISKEGVEQVLKPLQQQVDEFKKRIEQVHTEETKEMATLLNEIKTLKELNRQIGEDAVNLTRALKGESKQQGIWGEMVLERVLEASGLREGEEYEREVSLQDGERRRFRPDVVVHLPDDRDIIIDAKTSLVAYERYVNAETDEEKALYAKHHLAAVKSHIDKLSDKRYTSLEGVNTLDFIFMFMPIEGALMLALQIDSTLYDKAFAKHIVLVSPTTLLVALRAVENTWRHERQNRNAMEIAKRAGALYDKFVGFAEDLEKVGKQLDTVQKTYDGAWKKLTEGRGNIVRQVMALEELGAKSGKKMPKKLADAADGGNELLGE